MSRNFHRAALAGASSLALLAAAPLAAQPTGGPGTAATPPDEGTGAVPAAEDPKDGVITVTARKREETLIDVPVAVDVVGAQEISRNLASDLSKIGELTPTVIVGTYKSNAGGSLAIRGISSPANQSGFEQAVSVALDGVQTSDGRIAQLGFFDIAQVEVLKGPQALFFGKNSPAGVISVKTADPTSRLTIAGRAAYEFVGDEVTTEVAASGPLNDMIGARLAVRYRNLDGWIRNTAKPGPNPFFPTGAPAGAAQLPGTSEKRPGDKEMLGRLTLKAEPTDNFTARLKVTGGRNRDNGPGVATQNIGCVGPFPRYAGVPDPSGECKLDNRTTVGDVPPVIAATIKNGGDGTGQGKLGVLTMSLDLGLDLGFGSLNSVSGYHWVRYAFFSGLDQTSFSQVAFYGRQSNETLTQEVRFTSNLDGPFNFMVGAFLQDTEISDFNDVKVNDRNFNPAANRYVLYNDLSRQDGSTFSVFAQGLFDITPDLELAGGARWTREKKLFQKRHLYGLGAFNSLSTLYPGSDEPGVIRGTFRDSNVSPEVTLSWRPGNNRTLYVAYKTGFKSGGFGLTNPLLTTSQIGEFDYDSEKVKGFELGAKGLFLDNRLRVSAAAFAYKFRDLQVNTFDPQRIAFTINNAGGVKQRGAEVETNFRATDMLTLHAAVAYVRNRFFDFVGQCYGFGPPPAGTPQSAVPLPPNCTFALPGTSSLTLQQDFSGRAPARSPDWAGNAGFQFTLPLGNKELGLTGDAFYSDGYYAAETMAPATYQDSFWRFNASARIADADDRWSLALIGRNLTNKYFMLYAADRTGGVGVPLAIGEQRAVVARGREVAVQATFKM